MSSIIKVKVVELDDLAHTTPMIYLKKIHSAHRSNKKLSIHGGNIGGMWEQFIPTKDGVLWYFGEIDKNPKFISNDICDVIPQLIRDKEDLMKSIEKHYKSRK